VLTKLVYSVNHMLEGYFPEQRLFLKSYTDTRFIRLRPWTQAVTTVVAAFALAWTILATAILLMDSISAGSSRDQIARQQALYEERLTALSQDRDLRAEEAAQAQARFNLALAQVSVMQSRLLASEDRRRELETGIDVVQNTLRRTIDERDTARLTLSQQSEDAASGRSDVDRLAEASATLDLVSRTLSSTANERDLNADRAADVLDDVQTARAESALLKEQGDLIFTKLEEALTVSVEPLEKMFEEVGLSTDSLLETVRQGYDGQGGPLTPIALSTKSPATTAMQERANEILAGLDQINMYRVAAFGVPLAMPVKTPFRWTSGFGMRKDPKGWGRRMHEGVDMAGAHGSPIYATADGVISQAGNASGYGRLIKIQHAFGLETRYGHLYKIDIEVGQRVSRGDKIGAMGNTGRSTGTHLHYEIRSGGRALNPMTFIKAATNVF
jgi:murein DD-endopeptidase MepM/ murein hydrolase activator NlpD